MCGLALHGDLTIALAASGPVELEHHLESVKILPPGGYPPNDRELYGAITEIGASLPEIAVPKRRRVYTLAVTADDTRDRGSPSSWSAAVDALSFGDGDDGQRLHRRLMDRLGQTTESTDSAGAISKVGA